MGIGIGYLPRKPQHLFIHCRQALHYFLSLLGILEELLDSKILIKWNTQMHHIGAPDSFAEAVHKVTTMKDGDGIIPGKIHRAFMR